MSVMEVYWYIKCPEFYFKTYPSHHTEGYIFWEKNSIKEEFFSELSKIYCIISFSNSTSIHHSWLFLNHLSELLQLGIRTRYLYHDRKSQ